MSKLSELGVKIGRDEIDLPDSGHAPWAKDAIRLLIAERRSEETRRAYERDLYHFFTWAGRETGPDAVQWLCQQEYGSLALLLNGYKANLLETKIAEATINRRLSAIRSLLRFARRLGAPCPDPAGLVESEKTLPYRDTTGPEFGDVAQLLSQVDRTTVIGKRDYAMLRLLAENALRRGEVCRCDISDFDANRQRLFILGKGRGSQKEPITLSEETTVALSDYLTARLTEHPADSRPDAPLFASYGRGTRSQDGRLTGNGLWRIVDSYSRKTLGKHIGCHALRHSSITAALDATNGDVRAVQRLSRHADLRTLQRYDDNRTDLQGAMTRLLSERLKEAKVED